MIEVLLVGFLLASVMGIKTCIRRRRAACVSPQEMTEAFGSTEWRLNAVVNRAMQEMLNEVRCANEQRRE